jgi:hypothetical protein
MPINHTVHAARTSACCRFAKNERNRTVLLGCWCHHLGADQIAFSRVLTDHWKDFNVTLDYDSNIFYVASGPDWVGGSARNRMKDAEPCVVHVPGVSERYKAREPVAVDQRRATMKSLFADFALASETTVCELQLNSGTCASSPRLKSGVWLALSKTETMRAANGARTHAGACQVRLRAWAQSCGPSAMLQMRVRSTRYGVKFTNLAWAEMGASKALDGWRLT